MIDHGDRLKRTVCDICDRPFDPKRIIPVPNICVDCRATFNRPAYPPQFGGDDVPP